MPDFERARLGDTRLLELLSFALSLYPKLTSINLQNHEIAGGSGSRRFRYVEIARYVLNTDNQWIESFWQEEWALWLCETDFFGAQTRLNRTSNKACLHSKRTLFAFQKGLVCNPKQAQLARKTGVIGIKSCAIWIFSMTSSPCNPIFSAFQSLFRDFPPDSFFAI